MVNILVVDDERLICEGLKKMIEHLKISEINNIFISSNTLDALELAKKIKPEIIITDICMPNIDGLELIDRIKVMLPRTRFIVLSGYDHFSYVKNAFKLGSLNYLLKPASMSELEETLINAIDKIALQIEDTKLDEKYNTMISEKVLNSIFIDQEINPDTVERILRENNIMFKHKNFSIAIISFINSESDNLEEVLDLDKLQTISDVDVSIVRKDNNSIIFIFNFLIEYNHLIITDKLQKLIDDLKRQDIKAQIVLSNIRRSVQYLNEQYCLCTKGFLYKIFYPYQVILMNKMKENGKENPLSNEVLKDLRIFVKEKKIEKISFLVDQYFVREKLFDLHIEVIETMFHSFLLNIVYIYEGQYPLKKFSHFESLIDLRIYLKHVAINMVEYVRDCEKTESIIEITKKYILENYHRNISLAEVSNVVSMNYSYFSKFFKKETGLSYVEYLTKIRMEEAKRLLADPTNKIYEVSIKVGYDNPKYFTRTFTTYFGVSPKSYRASGK